MLLYTHPLQLREGERADGKVDLTALLAAAISSYISLMPEAGKSEPWFVFENKSMIWMCLEHDTVVSTAFSVFHLWQNRTSGTLFIDCLSLKTMALAYL